MIRGGDRTRRMPSVCSRFQCALLGGLLLCSTAPGEAQPRIRQVLLLQSFTGGILTLDSFSANFRVDLEKRSGTLVNVVQVAVGATGFVGAPEQAVVDYVRAIFSDRPAPDLIVTVG